MNSAALSAALSLNRLGAIVSVLSEEQWIEVCRLVYSYDDLIAESESDRPCRFFI